jgi:hypothetical protein
MKQSERRARLLMWADALDSGKFRQGNGALREKAPHQGHSKYCCLGVACAVYQAVTGKGMWETGRNVANRFIIGKDSGSTLLPRAVAKWFGFGIYDFGSNPRLQDIGGYTISSVAANDDMGLSFRQIARIVRHTAATL